MNRTPERSGFVLQAWLRWDRRRAIARFRRQWYCLTPHEQLGLFIGMLDRHPELRKAMRSALRVR
jgi:hypothetical protein